MGQNLFSRHVSPAKPTYSHRNDHAYDAKHHKENYHHGRTSQSMATDDSPLPKRRRTAALEISNMKHEPVSNIRAPFRVEEPLKLCRSRRSLRSPQERAPLSLSVHELSKSKEKRIIRQSPREGKKLMDRNNIAFHELRSSKKCAWIKEGLWTAPANHFNPPSCPEKLLSIPVHAKNVNFVEIPLFRRNPCKPAGKASQQAIRLNSLSHRVVKSGRSKEDVLDEDITDEAFHRRHRKSEDLEKKIVRWDRQRQRELEYYEYLKHRQAQRKTAQWALNLCPAASSVTSGSNLVSPSTKPSVGKHVHQSSEGSLWPSVENIQFIEILPSNHDLVNVTFCGQSLPSVDHKYGFSLPWSVTNSMPLPSAPQTISPNVLSKTSKSSRTSVDGFRTVVPSNSLRKKLNAAKAHVISVKKRKLALEEPSSSNARSRVLRSSPISKRSLISRSASLPSSNISFPKQDLFSTLTTRRGQYVKSVSSSVNSSVALQTRRRSQRNQ